MYQILRSILLVVMSLLCSLANAESNHQKAEKALAHADVLECYSGGAHVFGIEFLPYRKNKYMSSLYYNEDLGHAKSKSVTTKDLLDDYVVLNMIGKGKTIVSSAGIPVFDGPKKFRMQLLNGRVANVEVFAKTPVDPYTLSDVQDPPRPSHFYFYFWLDNEPKAKCRAEYYP